MPHNDYLNLPPGPLSGEKLRKIADEYGDHSFAPITHDRIAANAPGALGRNLSSHMAHGHSAHSRMGHHPASGNIPSNVREFVLKHYKDAKILADKFGHDVTAAEVLAIAGKETQWGSLDPKDQTLAPYGNFFGIHGASKYQIDTYHTTGKSNKRGSTQGKSVPTPIFPLDKGFLLSGQEFIDRAFKKNLITPGLGADPKALFTVLNNSGLLAAGYPEYPTQMICTPDMICPGPHPRTGIRGPYTFVITCIRQLQQEGLL